jgi:hypothetical protein
VSFAIGEVDVVNEVSLAPSAALYDGAVVSDGDLTVKINNFHYDLGGTHGKYLGSCNNAVTDDATNYVYLNSSAVLTINTTGYPLAAIHIRLARVIAHNGIICRIILERAFFTSGGVAPAGAIQKIFSFSDAPGPVTVGVVPTGSTIEKTVLEVTTPFDTGVQVSVGEATAMARLMAVGDNRLDVAESFRVESGYLCPSDMTVKIFFSGTSPTVGQGRVIVYYS